MASPRQHSFRHSGGPSPQDFDHFFPWAYSQLGVDATIIVFKGHQSQYHSVSGRESKSKPKSKPKPHPDSATDLDDTSDELSPILEKAMILSIRPVYVQTIYDEYMELVQIKFLKNYYIPRAVMTVLALMLPHHKTLSSIVFNSGVNAEVMYEISQFLPTSHITELCLDYTFVPEGNYYLLLNNEVLKHLSVAKCKINDDIVKYIAEKLTTPCPASKSLSALNLSTNKITDIGVKYLAEMLRSNRRLCYLNLADNMITDDGANSIFDTLLEFTLTDKETFERNKRLMTYLRDKADLIQKTLKELQSGDFDRKSAQRKKVVKQTLPTKKKTLDKDPSGTAAKSFPNVETHFFERAELAAETMLGPFKDPFCLESTVRRDDKLYCLGNNTLAYLNLAYNNITYSSLKKLCEVVTTQSVLGRKPKGLVNLRLEGNYLPKSCPELSQIDKILKAEMPILKRNSEISKRRTSTRR
ncbi:hypothetical protein B5X24_HaOG216714 [Helicoverpa armigera]|nr:hypothetical protein B5X24_HaOG216714 [Helicoverpa armigera]